MTRSLLLRPESLTRYDSIQDEMPLWCDDSREGRNRFCDGERITVRDKIRTPGIHADRLVVSERDVAA